MKFKSVIVVQAKSTNRLRFIISYNKKMMHCIFKLTCYIVIYSLLIAVSIRRNYQRNLNLTFKLNTVVFSELVWVIFQICTIFSIIMIKLLSWKNAIHSSSFNIVSTFQSFRKAARALIMWNVNYLNKL